MEENKKPSKTAIEGVKNEESFPFLVGTRKLSRPFRVGGGRCGLSTAAVRVKGGDEPGPGTRPDPPERAPLSRLLVTHRVNLIPGNCIRQQGGTAKIRQ